jgi:DGQHR domain-containing protein
MRSKSKAFLRRRALLLEQNPEHPLYLFSLTGDELLQIAEISRVSRDDAGKLIGYQRPEVRHHVEEIAEYLNGENVLFPNSIILALSSGVKFTRSRGPQVEGAGILEIPVPKDGETRPAWIVDGQQRALAILHSKRQNLPIPINAFIADDVGSQRDQFIRVNNTKPLPRGLLTELLPEVIGPLPTKLAARKLPAAITEQLNLQPPSPFYNLIKRASTASSNGKKAVIADTSIVKMIEDSLATPSGCLFPYRNIATGEADTDSIWLIITTYWTAVRETFPDAWGKSPTRSRLMHGVGIRSMGRLMDRIMPAMDVRKPKVVEDIKREIALIEPVCHWTAGRWEELGDLQWNEIQNVPRHIRALSNLLLRTYVQVKNSQK